MHRCSSVCIGRGPMRPCTSDLFDILEREPKLAEPRHYDSLENFKSQCCSSSADMKAYSFHSANRTCLAGKRLCFEGRRPTCCSCVNWSHEIVRGDQSYAFGFWTQPLHASPLPVSGKLECSINDSSRTVNCEDVTSDGFIFNWMTPKPSDNVVNGKKKTDLRDDRVFITKPTATNFRPSCKCRNGFIELENRGVCFTGAGGQRSSCVVDDSSDSGSIKKENVLGVRVDEGNRDKMKPVTSKDSKRRISLNSKPKSFNSLFLNKSSSRRILLKTRKLGKGSTRFPGTKYIRNAEDIPSNGLNGVGSSLRHVSFASLSTGHGFMANNDSSLFRKFFPYIALQGFGWSDLDFSKAYYEALSWEKGKRSIIHGGGADGATVASHCLDGARMPGKFHFKPSCPEHPFYYIPLRFKDSLCEAEYLAVCSYQLAFRFCLALICMQIFLFPIIPTMTYAQASVINPSDYQVAFIAMMFTIVTLFVIAFLVVWAILIPNMFPNRLGVLCRKHIFKVASLYSLLMSVMLSASLVIVEVDLTRSSTERLSSIYRSNLSISAWDFHTGTIKVNTLSFYIFFINLLFLDGVACVPARWSLGLHIMAGLCCCAPLFSGFVVGNLFSMCSVMAVAFCTGFIVLIAYGARYSVELQHRAVFYHWRESRIHLREMLLKTKGSGRKQANVEQVMERLTQCEHVVEQFRTFDLSANKELCTLVGMIQQCRSLLMANDDLYSVNLGGDKYSMQFIGLHMRDQHGSEGDVKRIKRKLSAKGSTAFEGEKADEICTYSGTHFSFEKNVDERTTLADISMPLRQSNVPCEGADRAIEHAEDVALKIGKIWSFDILALEQECGNSLVIVGHAILKEIVMDWGCCIDSLCSFLNTLQAQYQDNPYHNHTHSAMVTHGGVCLVSYLGIWDKMDSLEKAAFSVACLGHDVGHPGRTNNFFVASFDPLAIIYNDIAPLENFHSCLCFRIIERKESNIFFLLSVEAFRFVRAKVIDCILATDMKQHFQSISRFRVRLQDANFSMIDSSDDRWATLRMCVKMADISHSAVPWNDHFYLSRELLLEFYEQGDEERRRGLTVSPLCDRSKHAEFAKSQVSFLNILVRPLLMELLNLERGGQMSALVTNLNTNVSMWENLDRCGDDILLSGKVKHTRRRTCTKLAVEHLAFPALSQCNLGRHPSKTKAFVFDIDADGGPMPLIEELSAKAVKLPDYQVELRKKSKSTGAPLFDWVGPNGEVESVAWSPRFTLESTNLPDSSFIR